MKVLLIIIIVGALQASCMNDIESHSINSPSGKYLIKATVNRTNSSSTNYGEVIVHVYNNNKKEISIIQTGVGDANKWALGWSIEGDTIILQSADRGNRAWLINADSLYELAFDENLDKRAQDLYNIKYKK